MLVKIFQSLSFVVAGLLFLIFVLILSLTSHNKNKTFSGRCYYFLVLSSFLIIITEILTAAGAAGAPVLKDVYVYLAKLFAMFVYCWFCSGVAYFLSKFVFKNIDNDEVIKNLLSVSVSLVCIISCSISLFFSISYFNEAGFFVLSGKFMIIAYALAGILALTILYILITKYNELTRIHRLSLIAAVFVFILSFIFNSFVDLGISDVPYVMAMVVLVLYFTAESNDRNELELIRFEGESAALLNKVTADYMDSVFNEILDPINNIYVLCEVLKKNDKLSDEEIKDNMKYICDEAWKIKYASEDISKKNARKGGKKK